MGLGWQWQPVGKRVMAIEFSSAANRLRLWTTSFFSRTWRKRGRVQARTRPMTSVSRRITRAATRIEHSTWLIEADRALKIWVTSPSNRRRAWTSCSSTSLSRNRRARTSICWDTVCSRTTLSVAMEQQVLKTIIPSWTNAPKWILQATLQSEVRCWSSKLILCIWTSMQL